MSPDERPPRRGPAAVLWELSEEEVDEIFGAVETDERERYDRGGERGD